MFSKLRPVGYVVLALMIAVMAHGVLAQEDEPLPLQVGYWGGQDHFGETDIIPAITFQVREDGTLYGNLIFYPTDVPENAAELIAKNGCLVGFDTADENHAIHTYFTSDAEGYVTYWADSCNVKFFGDIPFTKTISGLWQVNRQPELAPVVEDATPIEIGIGIFDSLCSSCHGAYGDGNSDVPPLNGEEIAAMSDEEIINIIVNGVPNTEMGPWAAAMSDEQREGIIALLRDMDALNR